MYCKQCGEKIKEGSQFCTACGTPIINNKEKVKNNKIQDDTNQKLVSKDDILKKEKRTGRGIGKIIKKILGVIVIAVIILYAIMFLGGTELMHAVNDFAEGEVSVEINDYIPLSKEKVEKFCKENGFEKDGELDNYKKDGIYISLNERGNIGTFNISKPGYTMCSMSVGDQYLIEDESKFRENGYSYLGEDDLVVYYGLPHATDSTGGDRLISLYLTENEIIKEILFTRTGAKEVSERFLAEFERALSEADTQEEAFNESVETVDDTFEYNQYILPESNTKYLTENDVADMTIEEIRFAINEIYARHGRMYETEDLNEYFSNQSWYTPLYTAEEFAEIENEVFNEYEKENIKFLATIRDEKTVGNTSQLEAGLWGLYECQTEYLNAQADISLDNSADGNLCLTLWGSTSDGSATGEYSGYVVSENDNYYTAIDDAGTVVNFYHDGEYTLEIYDSNQLGGMNFPSFSGTYKKIDDYANVG